MSFSAELSDIRKFYGDVKANDGVNLKIRPGTIHALVGENGAGKSTAMKMLFGLVTPTSGKIIWDGKTVYENGSGKWSPQAAFRLGVGMVHQHFMLAGPESVLDNLVLGVENCHPFGIRNRDAERAALTELMKRTGLEVPLDAPLESLPVGKQSRCEILKVLYRNAKFLILDEPTAVLTPGEVEEFLVTLKKLKAQGNTILIVTHKLREVMAVADEATVLRAGKTVATEPIAGSSVARLSELMVGRKLVMPKVSAQADQDKHPVRAKLAGVELRAGQIVGIAGVEGNGQDELVKQLLDQIEMQDASEKIPLALIPSDRHHEGLILPMSLTENLRLTRRFHPAKKPFGYFADASEGEKKILQDYDVRPPDPELSAQALSGGNQQKLIVGRELSDLPASGVIVAVHPTRGVDLGAIEFIHGKLLQAATEGAAVLLISSELDELMALSHKIGAIYRGKITEWFTAGTYDEKKIGYAMLGGES